jgi:hypothetical protein
MSRSGYSDDCCDNRAWLWRGAVKSAIEGRRGQAFLRDLLAALHVLPNKRLIAGSVVKGDCVCAIGAVGKARGVDMSAIDQLIEEQDDYDKTVSDEIAATFGISGALAREIMFENDAGGLWDETCGRRYQRMVRWVEKCLRQLEAVE